MPAKIDKNELIKNKKKILNIIKTMEEYGITREILAGWMRWDKLRLDHLLRGKMSPENTGYAEACLYAATLDSVKLSVIKTWSKRVKAIGYKDERDFSLCQNIAFPDKSNQDACFIQDVRKFEKSLQKEELADERRKKLRTIKNNPKTYAGFDWLD